MTKLFNADFWLYKWRIIQTVLQFAKVVVKIKVALVLRDKANENESKSTSFSVGNSKSDSGNWVISNIAEVNYVLHIRFPSLLYDTHCSHQCTATITLLTNDIKLTAFSTASNFQGDHSPDNVWNSLTVPWRFAALLPMLSVTHIMPVPVLLSVVGVGMKRCMIQNQNEMHKLSKSQEWMPICS